MWVFMERVADMKLVLGGSSSISREFDLEREPAPTIMAEGIGGVCIRGWQYWVEDTVKLIRYNPAGQAKEPEIYDLDSIPCPTVLAGGIAGDNLSHYHIIDGTGPMTDETKENSKPPYRVPLMSEIEQLPWNGYSIVSTFSGCGGSCLGFRMAGYKTLWASEFIDTAREVYELNHPGVPVDSRDIRDVTPDDILAVTGKARGEIDVLEGSPPCASFSTAGRREETWGKVKTYSETKQRVDDLFFEFARLLDGLQPKVFVAENVSGLVKGKAKGYFKMILAALKECGYVVEARLLDAKWLGVPQSRQRIIFQGVRKDLGLRPAWPVPLPYFYSVREALVDLLPSGNVIEDTGGEWGAGDVTDRPAPTVRQGGVGHLWVEDEIEQADISEQVIGTEWSQLEQGQSSEKYFNLARAHLDKPSPVVTQTAGYTGAAGVTHPTERRKFYIAELKRICAFPDDFQLTGSYQQQWERLGRAVPPLMMRAVALVIRDEVLGKLEG